LILDGKKGGLVKGSTPSSAAKKACKKLSAETGKTSFKFELQETTKDSKKKVYGPYKGSFVKDKIKVKMVGGKNGNKQSEYKKNEINRINSEQQIIIDPNSVIPINIENTARQMAKDRIIGNKGQNFYENPKHSEFVKRVTERIAKSLAEKSRNVSNNVRRSLRHTTAVISHVDRVIRDSKLSQYSSQLLKINKKIANILITQNEYKNKNLNEEINKLTENVSFNEQEANRILNNYIFDSNPNSTDSIKLNNLLMARKIILDKLKKLSPQKNIHTPPKKEQFNRFIRNVNTTNIHNNSSVYNLEGSQLQHQKKTTYANIVKKIVTPKNNNPTRAKIHTPPNKELFKTFMQNVKKTNNHNNPTVYNDLQNSNLEELHQIHQNKQSSVNA
jgi:hypothetical protein